jgi:hypothetical protein
MCAVGDDKDEEQCSMATLSEMIARGSSLRLKS